MNRSIGPVTIATGGAAAATTVVVWIASLFGLEVPVEVAGALTTLIVFVAGYMVNPADVLNNLNKRINAAKDEHPLDDTE